MTDQYELEPCPFCGSKELEVLAFGMEGIHEDPNDRAHAVCCDKCGALGAEISPRQRAILAWNKRIATAEGLHWKHNHDSVVRKSRVLIDRKDMPLERVQAFKYITEMEERIERLLRHIETLESETK